ncbi:MAG: hypothetical protein H0W30_15810, partial [Gemmatimonadaceae bacterium]|nr:hypothetical protein [Gemmatimonadaceae bacterium]
MTPKTIAEPAAPPPAAALSTLEQRHEELSRELDQARAQLTTEREKLADGSGTTKSVTSASSAVDAIRAALQTVQSRQAKAVAQADEKAATEVRERALEKCAKIAREALDALAELQDARLRASFAIVSAVRAMPKQRAELAAIRMAFIEASEGAAPGLVVNKARGDAGRWSDATTHRFFDDLARHGVNVAELKAVTAMWTYHTLQIGNAEAAECVTQADASL